MKKETFMRHPVWILNSVLLFLFFVVLCFILLSRPDIPQPENSEPGEHERQAQPKGSEVNIEQIYKHDLFGTYIATTMPEPVTPDVTMALPEPPAPVAPTIPQKPRPQFLEPLGIALKGIMIISKDDTQNKAIIADNQTKKEQIYKMGDMIQDAHLIKIFRNKVIFLRSNGQQEVVYLRQQDAQLDPTFALLSGWDNVVKQVSNDVYLINADEFALRVNNLAHFIDLLELTTAYQKGNKVGCKIGGIEKNSLASALGLEPGDIILAINTIPATDSANRLHIYDDVLKAYRNDDDIRVEILRGANTIIMTYTFGKPRKRPIPPAPSNAVETTQAPNAAESAITPAPMPQAPAHEPEPAPSDAQSVQPTQTADMSSVDNNEQRDKNSSQQSNNSAQEISEPYKKNDQDLKTIEQKQHASRKPFMKNPQQLAHNKKQFDPTLREQRMRERKNMLQRSKAPHRAESPLLLSKQA
jgi:type II secretory pathway component PulC